MSLELLGVTVHEPDVAFTDLGLAILGGWFGWRLRTATRTGFTIMVGLAGAALFGAFFHAFFPAKTSTAPGRLAWAPVVLSIALVAATLLRLALSLLMPRLPSGLARALVLVYALTFAAVALLVDHSFTSIVRFYGPVLLLVLIAAVLQWTRTKSLGWALVAGGLALSVVAALLQQAGVSIHPQYFNHNAVYHVVQGIALVLLYYGFLRAARGGPMRAYVSRTDPAARPG
jgi:hypothetical protein